MYIPLLFTLLVTSPAGLLTLGPHLEWDQGRLALKQHLTVGWQLQQECSQLPHSLSKLLMQWTQSCMLNQVTQYAHCSILTRHICHMSVLEADA